MGNRSQRPWWAKKELVATAAAPRFRGVAYYRHSARDRQENSVAIQQELVQKWAKENGVEIIHEFSDRGKSGLTAEGRDGFNDMMENWVKKRNDFDFVLCLDVSRWGRFTATSPSCWTTLTAYMPTRSASGCSNRYAIHRGRSEFIGSPI